MIPNLFSVTLIFAEKRYNDYKMQGKVYKYAFIIVVDILFICTLANMFQFFVTQYDNLFLMM